MSKIENEKIEKEIRMSEIIDEQHNLVEEEILEDEIIPITPKENTNKTWDNVMENRKSIKKSNNPPNFGE